MAGDLRIVGRLQRFFLHGVLRPELAEPVVRAGAEVQNFLAKPLGSDFAPALLEFDSYRTPPSLDTGFQAKTGIQRKSLSL
jgi:hypothetical protein